MGCDFAETVGMDTALGIDGGSAYIDSSAMCSTSSGGVSIALTAFARCGDATCNYLPKYVTSANQAPCVSYPPLAIGKVTTTPHAVQYRLGMSADV